MRTKLKSIVKYLFKVFVFAGIFGIGWCISKIVNVPYLNLSAEYSLVDVLSLCATLVAAWYISSILETEKQDNRTQKDLIIKRTEDIYQIIDNCSLTIPVGNIPLQEINSQLKRINGAILTIKKLLEKTKLAQNCIEIDQINNILKSIRRLTTLTPIATSANNAPSPIITISNGIVTYSPVRRAQIEVAFEQLKDALLLLQIEINKS